MTTAQQLMMLVPVAYLLGAIPFGLIVGLSKGIDPREAGSGNIGATNLGRLLGGKFFALVFTLDMLKGLIPTAAASWVVSHAPSVDWRTSLLWLLVGFAAIVGHMFSLFLKFKGGKGVATSAGVMLGVWPYYTLPAAIVILAFLITFKISRIISLSSMTGAVLFPVVLVIVGQAMGWDVFRTRWPLLAFAVLVAFLVVWRHRSNIARLRAGTEPRFGTKKTDQPKAA
jgi:glycerol-3-phosphate acyltransferase PlsY